MKKTAYSKINWALAVYDRREDGFHNIDTVMQKISLGDTVGLEEGDGGISLCLEGSQAVGVPSDERNLAWKAAHRYHLLAGSEGNWRIRIRKEIPWGAGLGGGSADAAAVLALLEERCAALGEEALMDLAASLGSDIPFLLSPAKAARCTGLGESIAPFGVGEQIPLLVVKGASAVSTAQAYQGARARGKDTESARRAGERLSQLQGALRRGDGKEMQQLLFNDLCQPACQLQPEIALLLQRLGEEGALCWGMTGSGSACFAVFGSREKQERVAGELKKDYPFVCSCHTLAEL